MPGLEGRKAILLTVKQRLEDRWGCVPLESSGSMPFEQGESGKSGPFTVRSIGIRCRREVPSTTAHVAFYAAMAQAGTQSLQAAKSRHGEWGPFLRTWGKKRGEHAPEMEEP